MPLNQDNEIDTPMRRNEKEITDMAQIEAIIRQSDVCRLAMTDGMLPYVVPLFFGYQDRVLYFHSAVKGKKMRLIEKNPQVCVEFDDFKTIKKAEEPCEWGAKYRSVIAFGRAEVVEDSDGKKKGLDVIMQNYSDRSFSYDSTAMRKTAVIRVDITRMTGKQA